MEKFHCITLDSSGFKWNPVESTGIDSSCKEVESSWHSIRNSIPLDSTGILTFCLPNLLKYSTGFHWIQVESTGIQLELVGDMKDLEFIKSLQSYRSNNWSLLKADLLKYYDTDKAKS